MNLNSRSQLEVEERADMNKLIFNLCTIKLQRKSTKFENHQHSNWKLITERKKSFKMLLRK